MLAERPSLTLRQLRNALGNLGRWMSLQALSKHLGYLIEDGQVERVAHGTYRIRPAWIRELRSFCDLLERNHQAHKIYEEIG